MHLTSLVPSISLRAFLENATTEYATSLQLSDAATNAAEYLMTRSLSRDNVQSFRLGYVENPLPGHELYAGKISIPYVTRSGITSIRFRVVPSPEVPEPPDPEWSVPTDHIPELASEIKTQFPELPDTPDPEANAALKKHPGGPKYLSVPGDMPRIFNPRDLERREPFVCIAEGEFDAMSAHSAGLPAVGIAGVNGWRPYFARCFQGYESVFVLCDNDDKGQGAAFGEKVASQIPNARVVLMPPGHDVNSLLCSEGAEALRARLEVEA
ncbi:toprim domain-containing protein [Micromonospora sp. PSH03]|uniref:toprim domain-containing protein n=1 Tax=Micromonospora salmantinae TaxID=2911211 RepID=UPI001EE8A9B0|nr:toprim domain-containing protein [Micromonospora salmantinae]MCG5459602.1 toprim domain-containing protein [Micromonospora salmantinae]